MNGKKRNPGYMVILLIAVVVVGSAGAYGAHVTGQTEFCVSCHEMKPQEHELKFSSHAKDKDGQAATLAMTLEIPVIANAVEATKLLKAGAIVELDADRGLVRCVS